MLLKHNFNYLVVHTISLDCFSKSSLCASVHFASAMRTLMSHICCNISQCSRVFSSAWDELGFGTTFSIFTNWIGFCRIWCANNGATILVTVLFAAAAIATLDQESIPRKIIFKNDEWLVKQLKWSILKT